MKSAHTLPLALALLLPLCACSNPAKHEASSLITAVDAFRRADNSAKPTLGPAIAAVSCTDPEVCRAKDACVAASTPTIRGLALKSEVEAALNDYDAGRASADDLRGRDLAGKLDQASGLLAEGHAKLGACDLATTALRMKYGL